MWKNCHFRHICHICCTRQLVWAPSLLCALPCWQMWQNCHFHCICQIHQLVWVPSLLWGFALPSNAAKLSFSPYWSNLPTFSYFCYFCCCMHFWTYLDYCSRPYTQDLWYSFQQIIYKWTSWVANDIYL